MSERTDSLQVVGPLDDTRTIELRIAESLRDLIVSQQLKPGTRLPLRDLAKRFGVSVTPVRLAMRDLISDGLVEPTKHGGMRVAPLSLEQFEQVWSQRSGVEPWMVRRGVERIDAQALAELETLLADVRAAAREHHRERYVERVWRYRLRCYEAADRPHMMELVTSLYARSRRYNHLTLASPERIEHAFAATEQLHEAIVAGDGRRAQQVMREALDWTADYVLDEWMADAGSRPAG